MDKILEHFVSTFYELYGSCAEPFLEEEGRRRFLLFIRPIINGTGNYYVEAETRDNRRMDLVIDYLGTRHVVEMKIWRGAAYHKNGERQLVDYLNRLNLDNGSLLTYNFSRDKVPGVSTVVIDGKTITEAMV